MKVDTEGGRGYRNAKRGKEYAAEQVRRKGVERRKRKRREKEKGRRK